MRWVGCPESQEGPQERFMVEGMVFNLKTSFPTPSDPEEPRTGTWTGVDVWSES